MTIYSTKVYSMKYSIKIPNVTVSAVAQCQYKDNVLIAQKITVTKTTTVYQSMTTSMKQPLRDLEISK